MFTINDSRKRKEIKASIGLRSSTPPIGGMIFLKIFIYGSVRKIKNFVAWYL
ncbi:MAG: hypothetical protein SP4CHLAM5_04430 [Chlamydiia bacterium]|nr:hypothetical protein [Chlamydiia bacterium]MCH9624189.1 hypothetical protein [Chlamydiia bacterium]